MSAVKLPQFLTDHRDEIRRLGKQHGALNVRVFGSAARGELHTGSDVDLLIDMAPKTSAWFPAGFMLDLERLLGRKIDVVTEASLHPLLREQVLREAIPL